MTQQLPLQPTVSVVTPVLDRVDTVGHSLAAVAAQRYPHVEHIVADGGSTDGTLDVIEDFARDHPVTWFSEPDGGMYDGINKGLVRATGHVFAYLNSDDLWFPWTLEVAVEALTAGADLCYGDLAVVTHEADRLGQLWLQFYRPFDVNYYTYVKQLAQPTVVWRRSVSDELGLFDDSYRLIGDCEYWLRAAAAGKRLVHVDEVQAVQIEHAGTLRATQAARLEAEFARLQQEYAAVAGPQGNARVRQLQRSLAWRVKQFQLRVDIARPSPRHWPRFIGFLRQHDLDVNEWRLLQFQLPGWLRPDDATWLDPEAFEAAVIDSIAARA